MPDAGWPAPSSVFDQGARALQRLRYQTSALALDLHDQIHSFTEPQRPTLPGAGG